MSIEPLALSHRPLLYDRIYSIKTDVSEYSFANLYLFRNYHDYHVVTMDDEILVKGKTYDGYTYYMPITEPDKLCRDFMMERLKEVDFIFPADEDWLSCFKEDDFRFEFKEGDTDYIYTVEKMTTYKGRKLHKKRNLLKQYNHLYDSEHCRMDTLERVKDAKWILNRWMEEVNMEIEETDYHACCEALKLKDELGLCGVVFYTEGKPSGFVLGEGLSDQTFVLHFAKGLREYKGLYQHMYNSFAMSLPEKYDFINFEQDLGKVALRVAKSSYVPDILKKKYRIMAK